MPDEQTAMTTMEAATPRIPLSTYRLQLNRSFTFADAAGIVPYLNDLGITDCYCSSFLRAVPGSVHGYDLVDPTRLNPELGTETEFEELSAQLKAKHMGLILDVVPNHMGIGKSANPWWLDVLEHGPGSRYATFFDIDWSPIKAELEDKVLLPILGDLYGAVLEHQEITLLHEEGLFFVRHYEHTLPVSLKSAIRILRHRLDDLISEAGAESPHVEELLSIITAMSHLPSGSERDPRRIAERYRERGIIRKRLATVVRESPAVRAFIEENVRLFNGTGGDARSFDLLDELLNDQAYRLAFWRVASEEINYRRFFDINELAAIRMEDPAVFQAFHERIFGLIRSGSVTGLRIDHVDGLFDPADYLRQLQNWATKELAPGADCGGRPLFIVVEKILGKGEALPQTWPVYGTTGYEFLNVVNGLFVDGANLQLLDDIYQRFIGQRLSYEDLVYEKKKLIMRVSMSSEINVLGHQLNRLSERDRRSRDFTLNSLTHAIREIIACFPVYRTYVADDADGVMERDRQYIQRAVMKAKRRNPAMSGLVFDFVRDLLLNRGDERGRQDHEARLAFIMKFQQTTSPVTAKGIEDTTFYIYNRLASLNEVGGNPAETGLSLDAFHKWMRERRAHWPVGLSATSTHDTKRGEDVRARINVLSEIPEEWNIHVNRWSQLTQKLKTDVEGFAAPDRNEEYLLYQTLLGAWPMTPQTDGDYRVFCDRIQAYMSKALKESKVNTSWVNPNQAYDEAVHVYIEAVLNRTVPNPFLEDFGPFQEWVAECGIWNSLAQVLIKITAPGVPDFYQGTEMWDFSLVDPDNRRPVDYALRATLAAELQHICSIPGADRLSLVRDLIKARADGRIKLYVTMTALAYRRAHPELFLDGEYVPLETRGRQMDRVCAFTRIYRDQAVVTVVPRLVSALVQERTGVPVGRPVWADTFLTVPSWSPTSRYYNLLTGELLTAKTEGDQQVLPLAEVFGESPIALLERRT